MRTYDQLNPMEQAAAANKEGTELLSAITEGGIRFNDELNSDDLQARIDAAIEEANRMQTPWFAPEYVRDAMGDDLAALVIPAVQDAIYPDRNEHVICL